MVQPVSVACLELKIPGIPSGPHGLPPCFLDVFCCLDNMRSRIIASSSLQLFSITLLGQQTPWEARLHCTFCMQFLYAVATHPSLLLLLPILIPTASHLYPFFF